MVPALTPFDSTGSYRDYGCVIPCLKLSKIQTNYLVLGFFLFVLHSPCTLSSEGLQKHCEDQKKVICTHRDGLLIIGLLQKVHVPQAVSLPVGSPSQGKKGRAAMCMLEDSGALCLGYAQIGVFCLCM